MDEIWLMLAVVITANIQNNWEFDCETSVIRKKNTKKNF